MDVASTAGMERTLVSRRARTAAREEGFSAFYRRHHRDVVGLVYTLTGSWASAEDVAQEAFVRLYRDWGRVSGLDRPDSWVRTVAVNLATSRGRRLAAEGRMLARLRARRAEPLVAEPAPLPEDANAFWDAVRSLPRRQAQAVALRYHSDLSVADIAAVMGCAEGTVKAHLHAARRSLAERLGADEGAEER